MKGDRAWITSFDGAVRCQVEFAPNDGGDYVVRVNPVEGRLPAGVRLRTEVGSQVPPPALDPQFAADHAERLALARLRRGEP